MERLAPLTGKGPVPGTKVAQFRFEPDKFGASQRTPLGSEVVAPPRVSECPLQMEARVRHIWEMTDAKLKAMGGAATVEVSVLRVHPRRDIVVGDRFIDPACWQPLIYNFRHYCGLGEELGRTFRAEILANLPGVDYGRLRLRHFDFSSPQTLGSRRKHNDHTLHSLRN